jgi:hypothetical protein
VQEVKADEKSGERQAQHGQTDVIGMQDGRGGKKTAAPGSAAAEGGRDRA